MKQKLFVFFSLAAVALALPTASQLPAKKPAPKKPVKAAKVTRESASPKGDFGGPRGRAHRSPKTVAPSRGQRELEVKELTFSAKDGWLGAGSVIAVNL